MKIGGRLVGEGHRMFVVAELSANHAGRFERAVDLVKAAGEAGADAVKVQTYTASTLTISSDQPDFRIRGGTNWDGRTLYDLYMEGSMPWEWQPDLKRIAEDLGLVFFSTAYDATAVDFLESIEVELYKVASFELVDLALISRIAATRKPIILSTGMASLDEITMAVETARAGGNTELALLKCTSAYPANAGEIHLRTIPFLRKQFGVTVGISDHTMGTIIPVAARALGASILEKHLAFSRQDDTPDAAFSLDPREFADMVTAVRTTEEALGEVRFGPTEREQASLVFRRSLYAVQRIRRGEQFTLANVRSIRPGYGLAPRYLESVLGRHAATDIAAGTALSWDLVMQ